MVWNLAREVQKEGGLKSELGKNGLVVPAVGSCSLRTAVSYLSWDQVALSCKCWVEDEESRMKQGP